MRRPSTNHTQNTIYCTLHTTPCRRLRRVRRTPLWVLRITATRMLRTSGPTGPFLPQSCPRYVWASPFPLDLAPRSPRISSNSLFVSAMCGRPLLRPARPSPYTQGNNHIPSPSSPLTLSFSQFPTTFFRFGEIFSFPFFNPDAWLRAQMPPVRRLTPSAKNKAVHRDLVVDAISISSQRTSPESTQDDNPPHQKAPTLGTSRCSTSRPRDGSKTTSSADKGVKCEECGEEFSHRYMLKSVRYPYSPTSTTETDEVDNQTHGEARPPLCMPARDLQQDQGKQKGDRPARLGRALQVGQRDELSPAARQCVPCLRSRVHSSRQHEAAS